MSVSFLARDREPALAYLVRPPANDTKPTFMFLTGLASDMMGGKASFLDEVCAREGFGYVRFDFRGHGQSQGDFEDGTIGLWLLDAVAVLDRVIGDKGIFLIGSSMGGWVSLLLARAYPQKIKGLIGLAAAPDFTRDIKAQMNDQQKKDLKKNGFFILPSDYGAEGYKITQDILDDGEAHCVLNSALQIECPVRLIQGKMDRDVPWLTAQKIHDVLTTKDKKIIYRTEGDHRLSTPEDLDVLQKTVMEMAG